MKVINIVAGSPAVEKMMLHIPVGSNLTDEQKNGNRIVYELIFTALMNNNPENIPLVYMYINYQNTASYSIVSLFGTDGDKVFCAFVTTNGISAVNILEDGSIENREL